MFGIGMPEMILILAIALIVIGPKRLPELARSLGRAIGEFKKATNDLKNSFDIDDDISDVKRSFYDTNQDIKQIADISIRDENDPLKQVETPDTDKPLSDNKKTDSSEVKKGEQDE